MFLGGYNVIMWRRFVPFRSVPLRSVLFCSVPFRCCLCYLADISLMGNMWTLLVGCYYGYHRYNAADERVLLDVIRCGSYSVGISLFVADVLRWV